MMNKLFGILCMCFMLTACDNDARVASANISQAADNFQINRRIVFYNSFNGEYMLTIEGLCSLDADSSRKISIICKTGTNSYKKHYLGLSDNVTYVIQQLEPAEVSVYHYKVIFKPEAILPDIELHTSNQAQK